MTPPRSSQYSLGSSVAATNRFSMNGPLGVSLVAVAVIGIFVIIALFTTLSAAFGFGTGEGDPKAELNKLVAINKEKMQEFQDRFNGRSVFYKPPPWPITRPASSTTTKVEYTPPPPPVDTGPPKVYDGPGVWYAMSDVVRFKAKTASDKPMDIRVGEEKNGIKLIATNLPWTIRVGYKGGEYDVNVWERKGESFLLAQAPAIEIIPGLIEVPPARLKVEAPKADGPVETIVSAESPERAATPEGARPPRREARPNRQPPTRGADRPQTQTPSESRGRGRGRTVTPEEDGEEEDAEPGDPETENDAEAERKADEEVEADDANEESEEETDEPVEQPRRGQPPPASPPSPSAGQ
jgi:hypothetical protein